MNNGVPILVTVDNSWLARYWRVGAPVSFVKRAEEGRLGERRVEADDQFVHMRSDALVPDMPQKIEGAAIGPR